MRGIPTDRRVSHPPIAPTMAVRGSVDRAESPRSAPHVLRSNTVRALTVTEVRAPLAALMADRMKLGQAALLANVPFSDLSSHFDSLSLLEAQLLVEQAFGFELAWPSRPDASLPATLDDLAAVVVRQHHGKAASLPESA